MSAFDPPPKVTKQGTIIQAAPERPMVKVERGQIIGDTYRIDYATELAHERYEGGYGLQEVTAAVNLLEEAIWREISSRLEPQRFPEAFGLVSTVLGNTKTRLAVEYVALASRQHAPSLDLDRLFRGTN